MSSLGFHTKALAAGFNFSGSLPEEAEIRISFPPDFVWRTHY